MVKKAKSRFDVGGTSTIEVDLELNIRFVGFALDVRLSTSLCSDRHFRSRVGNVESDRKRRNQLGELKRLRRNRDPQTIGKMV